jgi:enoyl-CoA hydratase/carnithine racemase
VARVKADDTVRVLVLTGAGDKAFCAGADLGGGGIAGTEGHAASHEGRGLLADLFREMWDLGKPTIARVRGYALAGGFGLALACDFVIAADDAQFGTPEINVGLWPYMITVPLLRSMPPKKVLELMMTGRRVDAVEAERIGFVTRVVPVPDLDAAVDELASDLASKSPLILRWGRQAFYRVLDMPPDDALDHLQAMLTITSHSEDTAEGVAAFAEKRAPEWKGR